MIGFDVTDRPLARVRLAFLFLSPVLVIVIVVIAASVNALANLAPMVGATTDAGLARVGGDLALVIVTERGVDVETTRSVLFNWGILAPMAALLAGALMAWWLAGRVHQALYTARTQVEAADEERTSRLHEIVHELRTPLAVMGANLELADHESDPMGRSAKYIDTARRAVGRMSRTIDDLAGHGALAVETDEQPVDLSRLAETLVEDNFSSAAAKGVGVATVPGLQPVMVQGVDVAAVLRAADNFMTNAVRLAPRGSQILIDCGEFDGWGWLAVSDEGPGLASQHHGRVFERGWQGAHDRDRRGGSGLGLTIARQLTEAQGGRTTIESEEGGGATFALWLPIDPDADPESIVASDRIHPVMSPWAAAAQIV